MLLSGGVDQVRRSSEFSSFAGFNPPEDLRFMAPARPVLRAVDCLEARLGPGSAIAFPIGT